MIVNCRGIPESLLIEEGIKSEEFKNCDTSIMAKVLDGLINGLSYSCRDLDMDQTQTLYNTAISIFVRGISK
ncbi:TetR family transcriptional regulator C-terminal domain-containing protein [Paenibacillus xylanexedens]|uniref:TetR family transcriptional regulator C-terminal domain-containing protein n=1 Tax=Paenibacillus xylanexedens TaxID=528191 RepID=UPI000F543718